MNIVSVRHIDGPNVYLYRPIMVARIHLESFTEQESTDYPGFTARMLTHLPGLAQHHCAKGEPGGFVERLDGGTYFGHIVEHVAIEFASLIGLDVHYGKTVYADGPGIYDIVMECKAFECQKSLLNSAARFVEQLTVSDEVEPSVDEILDAAKAVQRETGLGPSTQAIMDACHRRGIPVRRLGTGSLLELGYGIHRKRISATITDHTSCVAVDIACNKDETKMVLREGGVRVPDGGVANTLDDALEIWNSFSGPVVVKPKDGRQGQGVTLDITTEQQLKAAFDIAKTYTSDVLVEQHVYGQNIRLLVVAGNCVAVSRRQPAQVIGDGFRTIEALILSTNADVRRGVGHEKPLTQIHIDEVVKSTLAKRGESLQTIPAEGKCVVLRDSANLSTGGEAYDITDEVHPTYKQLAERAARIVGLDVCGIDMVVESPVEPATNQNCAIIEVNAAPGIRMHQHPSQGQARDVADHIVSSLYPNWRQGRIPIVSITGTNGKTTTTRLIAHGLELEGRTVGMTTTGGVYIGGKKVVDGDTTGPGSARMVLTDPAVETAVLETARGGIVRGGLAYDKADVAVLTNISLDHVGQDGIDSVEDLLHVKSLVAECVHKDGTVVLNADDASLVSLIPRLQSRIVLISSTPDNLVVKEHLRTGGTALFVEGTQMIEASGMSRRSLINVADIPLTARGTIGFHVENALLAAAAMRASGMTRQSVAVALKRFLPERNEGRCMIYRLPEEKYVILDYAHNPAGFARIGEWLQKVPHRRLVGVVGVPGDRDNQVVIESANALASTFDMFIVKEDADKRGRKTGEIASLMLSALRQAAPKKSMKVVLDECDALSEAAHLLQRGDIACLFYEEKGRLIEWVQSHGGVRVSDIAPIVEPSYAML